MGSDWNGILRPRDWCDVVGQAQVVEIITNSLKARHFPKFSIFTGPPGVGKSSIAELVAKALVCTGESMPCNQCEVCKEVDAGSYAGVKKYNMAKVSQMGEVTEVLSQIFDFESFADRTVYILEEVQELEVHKEQSPWLEELMHIPDDVYIVMCTTQPYKLRQELRDRASIFELSTPSDEECYGLIKRASMVCGFELPSVEVCRSMIAISKNNPRLIISSFELMAQGGCITEEKLEQFYSVIDTSVYVELFAKLFDTNVDLFEFVGYLEAVSKKHKLVAVLRGLKEFCMRALGEISGGTEDYSISKEDRKRLRELIDGLGHQKFMGFMFHLASVRSEIISTKDAAEYELTMLKKFGMGNPDLRSKSQSVRDASIERDSALRAARVRVNDRAQPKIQEMQSSGFMTQSRSYKEVQIPEILKGLE